MIFDEPELHIHRSIASRLWDELLAARPDCGFVIITHDLEFAAARAAKKYVIRNYTPQREWTVESVPRDTGFDEETVTAILGSRRPILFVEGDESSIDLPIYRAIYPGWTVIPRGSCEAVIHAVNTLSQNAVLTRVICRGIVDADSRDPIEIQALRKIGIEVLPVSELENVMALPKMTKAIARLEGFNDEEIKAKQAELADKIFELLESDSEINRAVALSCQRRVNQALKLIDLSKAGTPAELEQLFLSSVQHINIKAMAESTKATIQSAIEEKDLDALLGVYSNKGILAKAASALRNTRKDAFIAWLTRIIDKDEAQEIRSVLTELLPRLTPDKSDDRVEAA